MLDVCEEIQLFYEVKNRYTASLRQDLGIEPCAGEVCCGRAS